MLITRSIPETRAALRTLRAGDQTLAFVPTMGALHAGHMALVAAARAAASRVVVSIFVNPLQFGPAEDLAKYPRPFEHDRELLQRAGVDLLFAPSVDDIYPHGQQAVTVVDVPELSSRLDGASRPGHFRGVSTVVSKLFHIVQPDVAIFGQKDAAQVAVLRRMVRDLDLPVDLRVAPTVREPDGLALSSRNRYLSADERTSALALSRALRSARAQAVCGVVDAGSLQHTMRSVLMREPGVRIDYIAVVNPDTLEPVPDVTRGALLAIAAHVGATRLIDNLLLPTTVREAVTDASPDAATDAASTHHA